MHLLRLLFLVNEIIWEYAQRGITYKAISNLLTTLYKIKLRYVIIIIHPNQLRGGSSNFGQRGFKNVPIVCCLFTLQITGGVGG